MASVLRVLQTAIRAEWPVRLAGPLVGKFNPFLSEFRADPYPHYAALRRNNPVYFSPSLRGWILSRYRDIAAVLQDQRFSADRRQATMFQRLNLLGALDPEFATAVTSALLMVDPPDHTRLRRLVSKAFTPRMVEQLRPRVQEIVDGLLDGVAARGEMDLIRDLAVPLPVIVIAEMLGVSPDDRWRFKEWSDALTALVDPLQAEGGLQPAQEAYFQLVAYLRQVIEARRRQPRDDLISALAAAEEQGERLTEAELYSLCMLLLGAGNETTTNLLGNAVLALLRHPEERRRLCADPSLIRSAVEEFLRFDSPVQLTDRVATQDCEIDGHCIRRGALVGLLIGAANRDPDRFTDPERLDVGRGDTGHLSFGNGTHFCLGAQLARVETQGTIASLLRRFPHFDGDRSPTHRKRSIVLRGLTSLRVVW
jgi:pimeloyl-[acyl-carrier protein] synthase